MNTRNGNASSPPLTAVGRGTALLLTILLCTLTHVDHGQTGARCDRDSHNSCSALSRLAIHLRAEAAPPPHLATSPDPSLATRPSASEFLSHSEHALFTASSAGTSTDYVAAVASSTTVIPPSPPLSTGAAAYTSITLKSVTDASVSAAGLTLRPRAVPLASLPSGAYHGALTVSGTARDSVLTFTDCIFADGAVVYASSSWANVTLRFTRCTFALRNGFYIKGLLQAASSVVLIDCNVAIAIPSWTKLNSTAAVPSRSCLDVFCLGGMRSGSGLHVLHSGAPHTSSSVSLSLIEPTASPTLTTFYFVNLFNKYFERDCAIAIDGGTFDLRGRNSMRLIYATVRKETSIGAVSVRGATIRLSAGTAVPDGESVSIGTVLVTAYGKTATVHNAPDIVFSDNAVTYDAVGTLLRGVTCGSVVSLNLRKGIVPPTTSMALEGDLLGTALPTVPGRIDVMGNTLSFTATSQCSAVAFVSAASSPTNNATVADNFVNTTTRLHPVVVRMELRTATFVFLAATHDATVSVTNNTWDDAVMKISKSTTIAGVDVSVSAGIVGAAAMSAVSAASTVQIVVTGNTFGVSLPYPSGSPSVLATFYGHRLSIGEDATTALRYLRADIRGNTFRCLGNSGRNAGTASGIALSNFASNDGVILTGPQVGPGPPLPFLLSSNVMNMNHDQGSGVVVTGTFYIDRNLGLVVGSNQIEVVTIAANAHGVDLRGIRPTPSDFTASFVAASAEDTPPPFFHLINNTIVLQSLSAGAAGVLVAGIGAPSATSLPSGADAVDWSLCAALQLQYEGSTITATTGQRSMGVVVEQRAPSRRPSDVPRSEFALLPALQSSFIVNVSSSSIEIAVDSGGACGVCVEGAQVIPATATDAALSASSRFSVRPFSFILRDSAVSLRSSAVPSSGDVSVVSVAPASTASTGLGTFHLDVGFFAAMHCTFTAVASPQSAARAGSGFRLSDTHLYDAAAVLRLAGVQRIVQSQVRLVNTSITTCGPWSAAVAVTRAAPRITASLASPVLLDELSFAEPPFLGESLDTVSAPIEISNSTVNITVAGPVLSFLGAGEIAALRAKATAEDDGQPMPPLIDAGHTFGATVVGFPRIPRRTARDRSPAPRPFIVTVAGSTVLVNSTSGRPAALVQLAMTRAGSDEEGRGEVSFRIDGSTVACVAAAAAVLPAATPLNLSSTTAADLLTSADVTVPMLQAVLLSLAHRTLVSATASLLSIAPADNHWTNTGASLGDFFGTSESVAVFLDVTASTVVLTAPTDSSLPASSSAFYSYSNDSYRMPSATLVVMPLTAAPLAGNETPATLVTLSLRPSHNAGTIVGAAQSSLSLTGARTTIAHTLPTPATLPSPRVIIWETTVVMVTTNGAAIPSEAYAVSLSTSVGTDGVLVNTTAFRSAVPTPSLIDLKGAVLVNMSRVLLQSSSAGGAVVFVSNGTDTADVRETDRTATTANITGVNITVDFFRVTARSVAAAVPLFGSVSAQRFSVVDVLSVPIDGISVTSASSRWSFVQPAVVPAGTGRPMISVWYVVLPSPCVLGPVAAVAWDVRCDVMQRTDVTLGKLKGALVQLSSGDGLAGGSTPPGTCSVGTVFPTAATSVLDCTASETIMPPTRSPTDTASMLTRTLSDNIDRKASRTRTYYFHKVNRTTFTDTVSITLTPTVTRSTTITASLLEAQRQCRIIDPIQPMALVAPTTLSQDVLMDGSGSLPNGTGTPATVIELRVNPAVLPGAFIDPKLVSPSTVKAMVSGSTQDVGGAHGLRTLLKVSRIAAVLDTSIQVTLDPMPGLQIPSGGHAAIDVVISAALLTCSLPSVDAVTVSVPVEPSTPAIVKAAEASTETAGAVAAIAGVLGAAPAVAELQSVASLGFMKCVQEAGADASESSGKMSWLLTPVKIPIRGSGASQALFSSIDAADSAGGIAGNFLIIITVIIIQVAVFVTLKLRSEQVHKKAMNVFVFERGQRQAREEIEERRRRRQERAKRRKKDELPAPEHHATSTTPVNECSSFASTAGRTRGHTVSPLVLPARAFSATRRPSDCKTECPHSCPLSPDGNECDGSCQNSPSCTPIASGASRTASDSDAHAETPMSVLRSPRSAKRRVVNDSLDGDRLDVDGDNVESTFRDGSAPRNETAFPLMTEQEKVMEEAREADVPFPLTWREAMVFPFFPSIAFKAALLLLPGIALHSFREVSHFDFSRTLETHPTEDGEAVTLTASVRTFGDFMILALPVLGMAFAFAMPPVMLLYTRHIAKPRLVATSPDHLLFFRYCHVRESTFWQPRNPVSRFLFSLCAPVGRWGPAPSTRRLGGPLTALRPAWILFAVEPWVTGALAAFITALPAPRGALCGLQFFALGSVHVIPTLLCIAVRPYRVALLTVLRSIATVFVCLTFVCTAALALLPSSERLPHWIPGAMVAVSVLQTILSVFRLGQQLSLRLVEKCFWVDDGKDVLYLDETSPFHEKEHEHDVDRTLALLHLHESLLTPRSSALEPPTVTQGMSPLRRSSMVRSQPADRGSVPQAAYDHL